MHKNIYVVGSFITLWSSKLCLRAIGKIIIPPLQTQFILTKTWKVFFAKVRSIPLHGHILLPPIKI